MNKQLVSLIVLALVSNAGIASDVGAPNPQLGSTTTQNEVGISVVETGASTSWANQPVNLTGDSYISVHQMKEFNARVDQINNELNAKLTKMVEDLLAESIAE